MLKSKTFKFAVGFAALMTLSQCLLDGDYEIYQDEYVNEAASTGYATEPGQTVIVTPDPLAVDEVVVVETGL